MEPSLLSQKEGFPTGEGKGLSVPGLGILFLTEGKGFHMEKTRAYASPAWAPGIVRMMSESPGSVMERVHTLKITYNY